MAEADPALTRDTVPVNVDAIVFWTVWDAQKCVLEVADYHEAIALSAVGGYGRGTLAPGSDIDLLFILPYKQTPWGEQVTEYILYMLWDLGQKVGHLPQCLAQ